MESERENFPTLNLSASGGVPVVSFLNSSETGISEIRLDKLNAEHFSIYGNEFDAYYDAAHKLIFVLDKTIEPTLLVLNPNGGRKWDDILANDWNMDLEKIRPKQNNKYQKLNISYSGLSIYNDLINGRAGAAENLADLRREVSEKSAHARMTAAINESEKAENTLFKTRMAIGKLAEYKKGLREKLAVQKRFVGKKPTKESAAKILKLESQIDAAAEKERRARRRLRHAERRLDIARRIIIELQPKAERMSEEIKPLFDKDPKIVDETAAFKPVGFETKEPAKSRGPELSADLESLPTPEVPSFEPKIEPVMNTARPIELQPTSGPDPAPPKQAEKPFSPISGNAEIQIVSTQVHRPGTVYYIMLVLLIGLSVLTLWLYQKRAPELVPNIAAAVPAAEVVDQPENDNPANAQFNAPLQAPAQEPAALPEDSPFLTDEGFMKPQILPAPVPNGELPFAGESILDTQNVNEVADSGYQKEPAPEEPVLEYEQTDGEFVEDSSNNPEDNWVE